jgi:hypothetical protein
LEEGENPCGPTGIVNLGSDRKSFSEKERPGEEKSGRLKWTEWYDAAGFISVS